jgi:hypothetical protein
VLEIVLVLWVGLGVILGLEVSVRNRARVRVWFKFRVLARAV